MSEAYRSMWTETGESAMKRFHWSYPAIRWVLGSVFIYSGGMKLLDPVTFAVLIEAYGLVPESLLLPVAVILASLELVAGVSVWFWTSGEACR